MANGGEVLMKRMYAIVNVQNKRLYALGDTAVECALLLDRQFAAMSTERITAMGFRVKPVMVTAEVLPETSSIPVNAGQGVLFFQ